MGSYYFSDSVSESAAVLVRCNKSCVRPDVFESLEILIAVCRTKCIFVNNTT